MHLREPPTETCLLDVLRSETGAGKSNAGQSWGDGTYQGGCEDSEEKEKDKEVDEDDTDGEDDHEEEGLYTLESN